MKVVVDIPGYVPEDMSNNNIYLPSNNCLHILFG
jgi:hypothetical protein